VCPARLRLVATVCAILACSSAHAAGEIATPQSAKAELDRLTAISPIDPQTLRARLDYAVAVSHSDHGDCIRNQQLAGEQLRSIIDAPPHTLVMTPDLVPAAMGVLANAQLEQAMCTEDDKKAQALLETAIQTARKASPLLEAVNEYADLTANQFNIAYALYELGETEGAFEELHKTMALNERYGQRDDLVENYRTMLEWQSPDGKVDEAQVDRYAESLVPRNVKFQFGWTPFDATVSSTSTRDVYRNEARKSTRSNFESELKVRARGNDLVMTTQFVDASLLRDLQGPNAPDPGAVLERLSDKLPATVIGKSGEIKSLGDVSGFINELIEQLVESARADPGLNRPGALKPDEVRTLATTVLSPQRIESAMRDEWETEVATWLGAELEHGAWYETDFESPVFGAEDQTIRNRVRFSVTQFVPCDAKDRDAHCVEVLMRNSPDENSVRTATTAMLTRMLPQRSGLHADVKAAADALQTVEVQTRLVMDPATLRPYVRDEVRLTRGAVNENGRRNIIVRRDERVVRTSYRAPTDP